MKLCRFKWIIDVPFLCVECRNSGQYSDDECFGWKSLCLSDEWGQFMTEHCSQSCNFCTAGIKHNLNQYHK